MLRRHHSSTMSCVVLAIISVSFAARAQDAADRGLLDSTVSTLAGGNPGDGAASATTVRLTELGGGIVHDSTNNIYFTEGNRVLKLAPSGALSVFAGSTTNGYNEGAKGTGARLDSPEALAIDAADNLYVYDNGNSRIRKIATDGTVTTVAGNGNFVSTIVGIGGSALAAPLPFVDGLAVNAGGDIFFLSNETNCIYKITAATGVLSVIAGNGLGGALASGTVASGATLGNTPYGGLALLGDGSLIYSASIAIYHIKLDGTTEMIAGAINGTPASIGVNTPQGSSAIYPDDGTRLALQPFNLSAVPPVVVANVGGVQPGSIAVDGNTIYFVDLSENRIRSFTIGGTIQTVFGERSEGGQTSQSGFRGNNSPAATNSPRLGVVVTAGPLTFLTTSADPNDLADTSSRPERIFSGANGIANTTAAPPDIQGAAPGAIVADDQTPRNDDPKMSVSFGGLTVVNGTVTFVDDGNSLLRQFKVGGNVNTVAGATAPFRAQNVLGNSLFTQLITDTAPVLARAASIFSPQQIARDKDGNFYFDAYDRPINFSLFPPPPPSRGHKIYKLDVTTNPAAPTVTAIAGAGLTNGLPSNGGDSGPATNAVLTGVGGQIAVLPDGTLLFADTKPLARDTTSTHTIRAVKGNVLSTIAGVPTISGNVAIDADNTLVKPDGTFTSSGNTLAPNRVGFKPSQVLFNAPEGVIGTSLNDFVVADTGNSRIVVVSGGVITQDISVLPAQPPTFLAQSGNIIFFANTSDGVVGSIDLGTTPATLNATFLDQFVNIDITGTSSMPSTTITTSYTSGLSSFDQLVSGPGFSAGQFIQTITTNTSIDMSAVAGPGAGPGTFTFTHTVSSTRGLALGSSGLFVLASDGAVRVASTASLTAPTGTQLYYFATGITAPAGLAVSGHTVIISEQHDSLLGDIVSYTDTGSISPLPAVSPFIGPFVIATSGASELGLNTIAPLAFSGANVVSGDDSIQQFRLITPQTPAPLASAVVLAGAGFDAARVPTADGELATNAADIGVVGGIAVDGSGAVFFSDQTLNTVRRISGGSIATIAGVPGFIPVAVRPRFSPGAFANNGLDGPALATTFDGPAGLAFNGSDYSTLYVADEFNNLVRKIVTTDGTGTVVRVAGIIGDGPGEGGEQLGPLQARLFRPIALTFNPNGDLYISEAFVFNFITAHIHLLSKAGAITTIAGGNFLTATYAPLDALLVTLPQTGMTLDPSGKLYVATGFVGTPCIYRVASGQIQAIAGDLNIPGFNGDGLPGTQTLLDLPQSIVFTPANGLVFTDTNNNRVRAIANLATTGNSPPTAVIVAKPDHLGTAPFLVQLDGSQSTDPDGDIVSYQWDFGDKTTGNGPQVEHTYNVAGSYPVALTVTDTAGNANTAQLTVFAAKPLVNSSSSGRGAFSVGVAKPSGKDTFSLSMKGVLGLTDLPGKPFTLLVGSFSISGTLPGGAKPKPVPRGQASAAVAISAQKKTVSVTIKNASLAVPFAALGVTNQNTIGSPTVLVPVVIVVNNGALVVGDKLLFSYKTKFNGKAMGKFSQ